MIALWLRFGSGWTFAAGIALLLVALAGALWSYRRALRSGGFKLAAALLAVRCAGLFIVALILLHPVLAWQVEQRERRTLAILLDDSRSMGIRDSLAGLSRAAAARRILFHGGEDSLAARLGNDWDLVYYLFASEPVAVTPERAAARENLARGERSLIEESIRKVIGADVEERQGALVVLTDGRETGASGQPFTAPLPVHLIGLGSVAAGPAHRDLALRAVHIERRALLGNRQEASIEIASRGFEKLDTRLVLRRDGAAVLDRAVQVPPGASTVAIAFVPKVAGHHEYEVAIAPAAGEENPRNNARAFELDVDARKLRVLYHEAQPRWKYKFLRQVLLRDRNLALTCQLRTNPARILQQGVAPLALHGGFPADLESLRAFDCVILGDLLVGDLSAQQWHLLVTWVNHGGGGLIFLGGPLSWSPGGIEASPLAEVLPCAGGRGELRGRLLVTPTRDGQGHPVLAGLEGSFRGARARLFTLSNLFRLDGLRPGAQVLANALAPSGEAFPLLLVQRLGTGRTLVFASDSDWKWVMEHRREGGEQLFGHLWGQAIRWVAGGDRGKRSASAGPALVLERTVLRLGEKLRVRVRGADPASLSGAVHRGEQLWPLTFEPDGGEEAAALFVPERSGRHEIRVRAAAPGGAARELAGHFRVEPDEREMAETTLDLAWLERIAQAGGGAVFDAATAARLPAALHKGLVTREQTREIHPRSTPWLFLAAVFLLGLEWWMRRKRYGL